MKQLFQRLRHAAEGVAAAMLFALFMVFLVQIAARYLFNVPMGWTVEVCLTLWLWIVFWGGAFCLRPADHIRFDVLYLSVNRPTQRIFGAISAVMIVAAFAVAFLPTVDYVSLLQDQAQQHAGHSPALCVLHLPPVHGGGDGALFRRGAQLPARQGGGGGKDLRLRPSR